MSFVPTTSQDRVEMLQEIGVSSFDELITKIPEDIRLKKPLAMLPELSEFEIIKLLEKYSGLNKDASRFVCFMGGGAYDHFIPSVSGMILDRSEFKTAYTPYQAEVSQGTLQVMYEYQSMICTLTGMDVSNASLYDGGSALAEACLLANSHNHKNGFIWAGSVNPNYKKVVNSICTGKEFIFYETAGDDGTCDLNLLSEKISNNISAVIIQQPNIYGNIEEVEEIVKIARTGGALVIVSVNPVSLGMLKAPGEYDADIVVGEGQPLGIPLSFGGPYLGILAAKKEFVRKIPGRLSGVTVDSDGKRAFVLTLQTREQQIKREKATSNICTNQGLFMLAATIYMTTMGKEGLKEVAAQCYNKAHYLAEKISAIPGFSILNDKPFFNEFLVIPPADNNVILEKAEEYGILGGIDTSHYEDCKKGLLVAVTEKRTKEELDDFVNVLKFFSTDL